MSISTEKSNRLSLRRNKLLSGILSVKIVYSSSWYLKYFYLWTKTGTPWSGIEARDFVIL